jgi:hypothetical protein
MALNFPNNPTLGQIYTENDKSFIWNGSVWLYKNEYLEIKTAIANAINEKGGSVTTATPFHMYPNAITELSGGGEDGVTPNGILKTVKVGENVTINKGDFIDGELEFLSVDLELIPGSESQFLYNSSKQIDVAKIEEDTFAIMQFVSPTSGQSGGQTDTQGALTIVKIIDGLPVLQKRILIVNNAQRDFSIFKFHYLGNFTGFNNYENRNEKVYAFILIHYGTNNNVTATTITYNLTVDVSSVSSWIIDSNVNLQNFSGLAIKSENIDGELFLTGAIATYNGSNQTRIFPIRMTTSIAMGQANTNISTFTSVPITDSDFNQKIFGRFTGFYFDTYSASYLLFFVSGAYNGIRVAKLDNNEAFVTKYNKDIQSFNIYNEQIDIIKTDPSGQIYNFYYVESVLIGGLDSYQISYATFSSFAEGFATNLTSITGYNTQNSISNLNYYVDENNLYLTFKNYQSQTVTNILKINNNIGAVAILKKDTANSPFVKVSNIYCLINKDTGETGMPTKIYYAEDFHNLNLIGILPTNKIIGIAITDPINNYFDAIIKE